MAYSTLLKLAASTTSEPTNQKGRAIMFRLVNDGVAGKGHLLSINPEDLQVTQPSRVSVQQTIGSAWVDSFGPGLKTISISGTTGWRAKYEGGKDWHAEFTALHEESFRGWHSARAARIEAGKNPDVVKLEFVDTLDGICAYVVPQNFVLKRSKSRPLLVQYSISMVVERDISDQMAATGLPPGYDPQASGDSLADSIFELETLANGFTDEIQKLAKPYLAQLQGIDTFLVKANSAMKAVQNAVSAGDVVYRSTIGTAARIAAAGRNLFATLAAVVTFPNRLAGYFSGIMGTFNNLLCLLKNGMKRALGLANYSDFYGASNCSSTSGGSPLSPLRHINSLSTL